MGVFFCEPRMHPETGISEFLFVEKYLTYFRFSIPIAVGYVVKIKGIQKDMMFYIKP